MDKITDAWSGINIGADLLQEGLSKYGPLAEWQKPVKDGEEYTEPWLMRAVDPVNIIYATRMLQVGFVIVAKNGEARVVVEVPFKLWRAGIDNAMVAALADKGMKLCDYCWNNHIFTEEGAYSKVLVTMGV